MCYRYIYALYLYSENKTVKSAVWKKSKKNYYCYLKFILCFQNILSRTYLYDFRNNYFSINVLHYKLLNRQNVQESKHVRYLIVQNVTNTDEFIFYSSIPTFIKEHDGSNV